MLNSTYLRISVTSDCNQSCSFCHKEGNSQKGELLSVDDIVFVCKIAQKLGFVKFKLTGGEPTLRNDILPLVHNLSQLGLDDLSMTTNGSTLEKFASLLRSSGLMRLNITLNTLSENRNREINPRSYVPIKNIISGIDLAIQAGYSEIKINYIYLDRKSEDELIDLINFTSKRAITLVLFPLLPTEPESKYLDFNSLHKIIEKYGIVDEVIDIDREGLKRAKILLKNGGSILLKKQELSSIKPYIFCSTCLNAYKCKEGIFPLRLSSQGTFIPCLANFANSISIKDAIYNRDEEFIVSAINKIRSWRN